MPFSLPQLGPLHVHSAVSARPSRSLCLYAAAHDCRQHVGRRSRTPALLVKTDEKEARLPKLFSRALALLSAGTIWLSGSGSALAIDKISEFGASGLFIKDTVETLSLEDPDVKGVTVYITDFKRSLADKLAKDFFSEPSQASVTCAVTGPIQVSDERQLRGSEGKEVFSEGRSGLQLFKNKTVRVRRVFDEKHKTLLYIAYSTRLGGGNDEKVSAGRYKTSICALPLSPEVNRATAVDQASVPASLTGSR
ncbi:hypothetical protein WJX84_001140 [Apatococcus fuscideae]|uniref:CreA protein n=1 Tax=Apatococcus fuscideae TaxID=2026836 RepID=A0AAW1SZI3_9CHLO